MTSHMKKKTKRFQDGGSAEDKRRGLAASKGESVGFFERLRMGNIDDPKSEAYKRFGAGRGQAETAKEKAAIKAYKGPSEPEFGSPDSPSPFTGSTGSAAPAKAAPAKAAAKKPAKAPIVTKEQLKASGFDNLRDYLNAQRGLTRRGEKSPRKPAAAAPRGSYRGTQDEGDAGEEAARKAQQAKMAKAREMRKQTDPGEVPASVRATQEASAKSKRRDMRGFAQMPFSEQMKYLRTEGKKNTGYKTSKPPKRDNSEAGEYSPFNKGGSVSSASKRADGIAVRGKTRCKVC